MTSVSVVCVKVRDLDHGWNVKKFVRDDVGLAGEHRWCLAVRCKVRMRRILGMEAVGHMMQWASVKA
jgi:hypothetical protein